MLIIVQDISYYNRRYAAVFAEVIRETDTRYYVRPIEGYAKGGRSEKYVDKADVIATDATLEMWEAVKRADEDYQRESERTRKALIAAHKAEVEAIVRKPA